MSVDTDLSLALDYLQGRVDNSKPLSQTTFKLDPEDERQARSAVADLLRSQAPPRRLLDTLAALFDGDDSLTSARRRLVIAGRPGRGRGKPRDVQREISAITRIKLKMLDGLSVERAIAAVADSGVGMSEDGLTDIWRRNPFLRSAIFSKVGAKKP